MRIIGALGDRPTEAVVDAVLGHGESVEQLVWEHGHRYLAPVAARRDDDGELVVTVVVSAPRGPAPELRPVSRDPDLVVGPDEVPVVRQRIAAYAVVVSDRGLLGTEYSDRTNAPGAWGLPGGGLDAGEEPTAAVVREVHEETSQVVELGPLVAVQTAHWIGRAPKGRLEDFHAVRLVYRAGCAAPSDPVVLDVGGTTSRAAWTPTATWDARAWTPGWRALLPDLLAPPG